MTGSITILSGVVWMRTVSVSEQSAGSATKMPFLASTWMRQGPNNGPNGTVLGDRA